MKEDRLSAQAYALIALLAGGALFYFYWRDRGAFPLFVSLLFSTGGVAFSLVQLRQWSNRWHAPSAPTTTAITERRAVYPVLWAVLTASVFIGFTYTVSRWWFPNAAITAIGGATFAMLHALFIGAFVFVPMFAKEMQRRESARTEARNADRLRIAELKRGLAISELKTMQAQIEPHFLYNVLANVQSMVAHSPAFAQEMLEHLIAYLKLALPHMRSNESTVHVELALAESYLKIAALRFGERLRISLLDRINDETLAMPPMLLLPLVENAVKHGIEPKPGRVFISVEARCEKNHVLLIVTDDGAGFSKESGTGVGLANVRSRLQAIFGDEGALSVEPRMETIGESGVTATLRFPKTIALA